MNRTIRWICAGLLLGAITACAPLPTEPVGETLDDGTGTTVNLLPRPVELITERGQGSSRDPFAYVAPFQTNRMGNFDLFLWVSAPQNEGPLSTPQLMCNDKPVALQPIEGELRDIGLSKAPYAAPAPWSAQWYFRLSDQDLQCLAGADRIELRTVPAGGEPETFSAEGDALSALARFAIRLAQR